MKTASRYSASLPVYELVFCGLLMTLSATSKQCRLQETQWYLSLLPNRNVHLAVDNSMVRTMPWYLSLLPNQSDVDDDDDEKVGVRLCDVTTCRRGGTETDEGRRGTQTS